MNDVDAGTRTRDGSRMRIPRSRGAASGFLLIVLGVWGALIPFVGPYAQFAYSPDTPWVWTDARGWLEVLPGAVAVLGGLLLVMSRNRATAMLGSWLAVAAGAWFIVGRVFASMLAMGDIGVPAAATPAKTVVLELAYFSGLGALIVFLGALALGRLSIRSARDIAYARRPLDVSTAAQPVVAAPLPQAMPDQRTEVIPTAGERPPRRGWRHLFGGNDRRKLVHH
ncbi:MAG: hypothetical protein JST91_12615 [Actinobacteria bacterium]|nr:hypothetical protein [Actinomycetota bacterium]